MHGQARAERAASDRGEGCFGDDGRILEGVLESQPRHGTAIPGAPSELLLAGEAIQARGE